MHAVQEHVFLLTGRPGIGKTTIIQKVIDQLGRSAGGFFTREVRQKGQRVGFEIVTLEGKRAPLATTRPRCHRHAFTNPHPFGRYTVNLDGIEKIAVQALHEAWQSGQVVVVDEIGPMEILSPRFQEMVWKILESGSAVLGTVVKRPYQFADEVKRHPGVKLFEVTAKNRDRLPQVLTSQLLSLH